MQLTRLSTAATFGLAALALSGCVSMSAEECATADWRSLGFQDGAAGNGEGQFQNRASACSKAGYASDSAAWYQGHSQGVRTFCRSPANAVTAALEGRSLSVACPEEYAGAFNAAYRDGQIGYQRLEWAREIESRASGFESQIRDVDDAIEDRERDLRDGTAPAGSALEQRIRRELPPLYDKRHYLRRELRQLERERFRADFEARSVRSDLIARWGGGY
jgi:hypothetical protein